MIRLHSNISKIICKNVNILIYSQNFGNFETYFFLNLYLRNKGLRKITPSMGCLNDIYIEFLAYTMLQIYISFAKLHNIYVLEYVELYLVKWNSLSLILRVTLMNTEHLSSSLIYQRETPGKRRELWEGTKMFLCET